MKKIFLFIGLLLILTGFSYAQGTKTIITREPAGPIDIYCFCGENYLGYAEGILDFHVAIHFVKGEVEWIKAQGSKSTLVGMEGEILGETFTISEMDKITFSETGMNQVVVHSNLKGDRGHHFIWSGYLDFVNGNVVYDKAICPEGK
jgi:hypothetical protein